MNRAHRSGTLPLAGPDRLPTGLLHHIETGGAGEVHVHEDERDIAVRAEKRERLGPVGGQGNAERSDRELHLDDASDERLVVDDQQVVR